MIWIIVGAMTLAVVGLLIAEQSAPDRCTCGAAAYIVIGVLEEHAEGCKAK